MARTRLSSGAASPTGQGWCVWGSDSHHRLPQCYPTSCHQKGEGTTEQRQVGRTREHEVHLE